MGALERFFTLAGEMGRFFAAFFLADCSDSTTLLPSRDCRQAQFTKHEVMEVKFEGSDGGLQTLLSFLQFNALRNDSSERRESNALCHLPMPVAPTTLVTFVIHVISADSKAGTPKIPALTRPNCRRDISKFWYVYE